MSRLLLLSLAIAGHVAAHGSHVGQPPTVADDANWMTRHMAEEHHIKDWDAKSFFALHDYNSDGSWQVDEVMRTYGLMDDSHKDTPQDKKIEIARKVMELIDSDGDGLISRAEWDDYIDAGETLPDMGTGPGHHGDDEYEYEIHHWEKYHDENTKLEDLTHPEDIEHFKKHEEMEREAERIANMAKMDIVESNIPSKFKRQR